MSGAIGTDPQELRDDPELEEVLTALATSIALGIRTHVPARVVTYDAATQKATIQVDLRAVVRVRKLEDLPPGGELVGTLPRAKAVLPPKIVTDIPVVFPGTSTAYLTVPITPGATGTLHVHDRSIDRWLSTGVPSDPLLAWTHVLESSEFHVGLHPDTQPIAEATDLTATVLEGPFVKVGRGATDPIAKAPPLITVLDALANATPLANDGGAAIQTAFKTAWTANKADVAAQKGMVE